MTPSIHPIQSILSCTACNTMPDEQCLKWKLPKVCKQHYEQLVDYLKQDNREMKDSVVSDLIKVFMLMQDPRNEDRRKGHLTKLENEMVNAKNRKIEDDPRFAKDKPSYLKLSRALEYYEGYCWFPANRLLVTTFLTEGEFHQSLKLGLSKDSGAGSAHGEQSHRVQWHIIMREVTCDFQVVCDTGSGWSCTPLELFYTITQLHDKMNLWFRLFDDNRNNHGWGNPDRVMQSLMFCGLPLINGAVQRRTVKYGYVEFGGDQGVSKRTPTKGAKWTEIMEIAGEICKEDHDFELLWNQYMSNLGEIKFFSRVQPVIYHMVQFQRSDLNSCPTITNQINLVAWHIGRKMKLKPQSRYATYGETKFGTAMSPDKGKAIDLSLVSASKNGFNSGSYICLKSSGATPLEGNKDRW